MSQSISCLTSLVQATVFTKVRRCRFVQSTLATFSGSRSTPTSTMLRLNPTLRNGGWRSLLLGGGALIMAVLFLRSSIRYLVSLRSELGGSSSRYGVMIDAGSTGSRVHVYEFSADEHGSVRLLWEHFQQLKPGLSSFANQPEAAANSLEPLLLAALRRVPAAVQVARRWR